MALTKKDWQEIDKRFAVIDKRFEQVDKRFEQLDRKFESRLEDFREDILNIFDKFRSDLFDRIDPILKEVLASREEREIVSHRLSDHEDRITVLEAGSKS